MAEIKVVVDCESCEVQELPLTAAEKRQREKDAAEAEAQRQAQEQEAAEREQKLADLKAKLNLTDEEWELLRGA